MNHKHLKIPHCVSAHSFDAHKSKNQFNIFTIFHLAAQLDRVRMAKQLLAEFTVTFHQHDKRCWCRWLWAFWTSYLSTPESRMYWTFSGERDPKTRIVSKFCYKSSESELNLNKHRKSLRSMSMCELKNRLKSARRISQEWSELCDKVKSFFFLPLSADIHLSDLSDRPIPLCCFDWSLTGTICRT